MTTTTKAAKQVKPAKQENSTQAFESIIKALLGRNDKDCNLGAKKLTAHVIPVLTECGIKPLDFANRIQAVKGAPEFVAQKSVRRACYTLQALAQNIASALPAEVYAEIAALPKLGKVSNELNRALLSRFVEFDENSENSSRLTNAGIKHSMRLRKSVSTASAQSSSLKDMFRLLGAVTAKKHGREFELDTSAPVVQRLQALISQ